MILAKPNNSLPLIHEPVRRLIEEGPLVVEYFATPMSPSSWIAHGVVVRGIPQGTFRNQHPEFVGKGPTEQAALRSLLHELETFLDEPYWRNLPCH
jgi:hypothetical protein